MQSNETGLRKHSTIKVKVPVPIKYHAMNTYTGVEIKVPHILNRRIHTRASSLKLLYSSYSTHRKLKMRLGMAQWPMIGKEKIACPFQELNQSLGHLAHKLDTLLTGLPQIPI